MIFNVFLLTDPWAGDKPPPATYGTPCRNNNGNQESVLKQRTSTRSFGTGKREAHDASSFYGRRLYETPLCENGADCVNTVPPEFLDCVFDHSSEQMTELPDNSVALMVTSPPYNVGKEYDPDLSMEEYLAFLKSVLAETHRVLMPGGRIAFNVANLGRKPYIPLNSHIAALAAEVGLLMRGEIIWVKGKGNTSSCAWGSWMSAANPTLRDLHEYVLIFSKQRFDRPSRGRSTIGRDEFMAATTSVWHIPAESARRVGHPAPFPVALVERVIHLYTFEGDVVLDPFMGSGSTAVAAVSSGRRFVGYEIDPHYVALCMERVSQQGRRSLSA
ncbi:MAG: site-specific DNA-methyltransferase [Desulfomonile tiedjei]|nr:site-specific DNA-methyltransferase [Desulfomonile tiedjei]